MIISVTSKNPKISVITPSFNCANYIRDCIESVLAQNYDNFEHIIVDGASNDATVEILKRYPHLKWISEPDKGEAEALNKALKMIEGDIIGWLNADDYYTEGVFQRVAQEINPCQARFVVYGNTHFIDEKDNFLFEKRSAPTMTLPLLLRWWEHYHQPHQPSVFYAQELINDIGPFNPDLYYSIDYDYWLRVIIKYQFHYLDQTFAYARCRTHCKSLSNVSDPNQSHWQVSLPYHRYLNLVELVHFWSDYWLGYRFSFVIRGILRRLRGILRCLRLYR